MSNIINRLTSPDLLLLLPAILIAITVHEFAHAFTSHKLGDPTPKLQGRLTLNPLAHLDPIGLVCLILLGFGWGRPVQINPRYYKKPKRDIILVSLAGPLSNILLVIISAIAMRFLLPVIPYATFWKMMQYMITINAVLCVFNLLPIPPLDGSKILLEILPLRNKYVLYQRVQMYSTIILLVLIYTNIINLVLTPLVSGIIALANFIIFI